MGSTFIPAHHLSRDDLRDIVKRYRCAGVRFDISKTQRFIEVPAILAHDTQLKRAIELDIYAASRDMRYVHLDFIDVCDGEGYIVVHGATCANVDELRRVAQRRADEREETLYMQATVGIRGSRTKVEVFKPRKEK